MEKELELLAREIADTIPEIRDEIELAADEDAMPEDVEKVERRVAALVESYQVLIKRTPPDERAAIHRELGMRVEILKAHLLKLRDGG